MPNDIDVLQKLKEFLVKVSSLLNFEEKEKKEFVENMISGFIFSVLSETNDIASEEINQKIESVFGGSDDQNPEEAKLIIDTYFKEISANTKGQEVIMNNFEKIVTNIMEKSGDSLTDDQIEELAKVLEE